MSQRDNLGGCITFVSDHVFLPQEEIDLFQRELDRAYYATTNDGTVDLRTWKAALRVKQAAEVLVMSLRHWEELERETRRDQAARDGQDATRAIPAEVGIGESEDVSVPGTE